MTYSMAGVESVFFFISFHSNMDFYGRMFIVVMCVRIRIFYKILSTVLAAAETATVSTVATTAAATTATEQTN